MRTVVWTGFAAAAATAVLAAPAGAAVTVGSDLSHSTDSEGCASGGCTVLQRRLGGVDLGVGRSAGVVVRWRVRDATGQLRLHVLRRATSIPGYVGLATGPTVTTSGPGVQSFETRIPVVPGNLVAVDILGGTLGVYDVPPSPPGTPPAASEAVIEPPLVDGQETAETADNHDVENLYNFDVEPDADADGYGDETQDACPLDGTLHGPCDGDLRVALSAPAKRALVGSRPAYRLQLTNAGSTTVARATLAFRLPAGFSAARARSEQPLLPGATLFACDQGEPAFTCTVGPLVHGAQVSLDLEGSVHAAGALAVTVQATGSVNDPNPDDNAGSATLNAVSPRAHVRRQTTRVRHGRVRIVLRCQKGGGPCRGTLRLSRHAGHGSYRLASGGRGGAIVKLSSRARRALRHHARLKLTATAVSDDGTAKDAAPVVLTAGRTGPGSSP